MSNTITIELSAQDRERLDGISKLLAELVNRAGEAKAETPVTTQPNEEKPTAVKEDPADEPKITLEQLKKKVVQLCAGFEGTKKAAVREIVNTYAKSVSDLPEDKWSEVWSKLTALEG